MLALPGATGMSLPLKASPPGSVLLGMCHSGGGLPVGQAAVGIFLAGPPGRGRAEAGCDEGQRGWFVTVRGRSGAPLGGLQEEAPPVIFADFD